MDTQKQPDQHQRRSDGEQTHQAILNEAIWLASIEGLASLTLGRLAERVGMSKSGLYAHFGSKERLQLEVIEAAREIFVREVIEPGISAPEGLSQVRAMCESYLSYLERGVFAGGCFFYAMMAEFDAQPGSFRESLAEDRREWEGLMTQQIEIAKQNGELDSRTDPAQLVFVIEGVLELANVRNNLDPASNAIEQARSVIEATIEERARPGRS